MIIGYDGQCAALDFTGLGNYSRQVIDVLSRFYKKNHYMVYTPRIIDNKALTPIAARDNVHLREPRHAMIGWKWRSGKGILRDAHHHRVHLFHGLTGELPGPIAKSGMASVVTVHDLAFKRFPRHYTFFDRMLRNMKLRHAVQAASEIIATSQCVKSDLVRYYGVSEDKIDVVYQGCDEVFRKPVQAAFELDVRNKYNLPGRYILSVGSIEERKNLMLAVQALAQIADKDVKLVVVGQSTPYFQKVKKWAAQHGVLRRIMHAHRVHLEDLPVFYKNASLLVYPSRYEGFGLPIIEAQACGCPVVAATGSSLEEAGGDAAIYVGPDDATGLAQAITDILSNPEQAAAMKAAGLDNVKRFEPQAEADALIACYKKALATGEASRQSR